MNNIVPLFAKGKSEYAFNGDTRRFYAPDGKEISPLAILELLRLHGVPVIVTPEAT